MDTTRTIKGYDLLGQIGEGGFGAVYRAHQSAVGREVAIKIILPEHANQPDFIRRFEGEAQTVARLEHPHITPLYDYWRDPEGAYLVMRWLRGGSLREALESGPFELRSAALLLDQIAGALSLAHRNGVIHRDIKPGNILLDEDGNVYLTDFGIAKDLTVPGNNTQVDAIVGSLDYISPEQARSEPVTARTDIYSLGVTMYEVISGHHPFRNMSSIERLYKHINDPLPALEGFESELGKRLNEVIGRATEKDPALRYGDALAFAADFREAIGMNRTSTTMVELLTQREQEILQLIIQGLSNKEIAQKLTVTLGTIKWYVTQIYSKMGVRSRVQAIVRARELNLIGREGVVAVGAVGTDDFVPENPYKGLRAFSSADHGEFFGREKVTQRLVGRMLESGEHSRFLAVVGPSGSGKSSLVKAGLIPAVWRGALPGSEKWFVVEMMPGALPLDELEVALIRVAHQASLGLREQLERDENGLARAAQLLLPSDGSELLLVIDQFEEVFTLVEDDATRRRFLDLLVAAVTATRSRVRVVITLRADFYDRPLQYARFGELLRRRQEIVLPLSAEELERAVVLPAQAVGVTFEQGLVSTIVSEVKYQPGALPLLQYALTELFERRQGRLLTQEAFREIGGVTGALASRAESLYEDGDATSREMIRQVFLRLVTLGEGTEDTRRRTLRSELLMLNASTDLVEDIIDTFARGRLLALDTDPSTREPTVEVAHEALLREWERLKGWLNASRDDIRQQRQLSALAAEWTEAKQDASYLVQGSRLGQLGAWAQHTDLTLTPQERLYLQMSMNERERQQLEDRARAVREEHLERRSQNFLRGLVGVFAVATVLSVGLTLVAFSQNQAAQAERARAEAAQAQSEERAAYASSVALASAARNALTLNNPDQALALALAANTVTDQPPGISRNALYDSAFVPATRWVLKEAGFDRIVNSPDGKHAFAMRDDNSAAVIDLITGEIVTQWTPEFMSAEDFICADGLLFAADGRTAFVEMVKRDFSGGAFIEFDIRTGAEVRRFTPAAGFPCHASYSADGQYIYVPTLVYQADTNILPGTIYQWSIASGDMIAEHVLDTSGLPTAVDIYLSVSADGRNAVGAFDTGHVLLWDLFTGERVHTILDEALRGRVWAVNLLPSGIVVVNDLYSRLATTVTLWDEVTGERISQHTWESNSADAQVSPDGRLLAISLQSANVALFDLVAWQPGITLHGHGYVTFRVEFTADLKHLVSVNADGTVRLWNLTSGNERQRLEGFSNIVSAFVISPDGTTAAIQEYSPGSPAQLGLWNLETGTLIRSVGVFVDSFRGIAFSPDGRTIAATSAYFDVGNTCSASSSAITLIDAATGERLWETALESVLVFGGITFSGNGSKVIGAAPECGDPLIILDAATGEVMETWEGHSAGVNFVTASHDGRWTASGSWDATAILWDAEGQSVHTLQHDAPVVVLAFSPDDRLLLTSSLDNRLHLWDVASGQRVKQLTGHTAGVWFVDFSPDGAYIVSSSQDFNVFIWDWQAGEVVRQFSVAQFGPAGTTAQFSPDGAAVYVQTADSGVVIHKYDLLLEPGALQAWISDNRYVRDLTCAERELYRIEPLCEDS